MFDLDKESALTKARIQARLEFFRRHQKAFGFCKNCKRIVKSLAVQVK